MTPTATVVTWTYASVVGLLADMTVPTPFVVEAATVTMSPITNVAGPANVIHWSPNVAQSASAEASPATARRTLTLGVAPNVPAPALVTFTTATVPSVILVTVPTASTPATPEPSTPPTKLPDGVTVSAVAAFAERAPCLRTG